MNRDIVDSIIRRLQGALAIEDLKEMNETDPAKVEELEGVQDELLYDAKVLLDPMVPKMVIEKMEG